VVVRFGLPGWQGLGNGCVVDTLWTMETHYDAVVGHENERKKRARYDRLIAKLTSAK
jgi:hypothetical protein